MDQLDEKSKESDTSSYKQWIATFGVFLLTMQIGLYIGWASPNAARLMSDDAPIKLDAAQVSWLISFVTIGAGIGSIVGSLGVEYIGSRKTLLAAFVLMSVSWICLIVANSVGWLYSGRLMGGLPCAMLFCSFSLYIGEISDSKIRGTLISTAAVGSPLGTVIGTVAETYLPMKLTSSIYLALSLIGVIMFLWLKDSPYFLMRKGDQKPVETSIMFYQPDACVGETIKAIQEFVETSSNQSIMDKLREFKKPVLRKSMLLVVIMFTLPHATGYMAVMSYMQVILQEAEINFIKPEEGVIYINIVGVLTSMLFVNLIDKLGRRFILIFSTTGTMCAIIVLGVHFYLPDENKTQWLPITAVLLYVITYSAGFNSLPSTVLSEIFSENMKSVAACLATLSIATFGFIVTKSYQPIVDTFGLPYAFWSFSVLCGFVFVAALILLPETKGKTFQEIQEQLIRR